MNNKTDQKMSLSRAFTMRSNKPPKARDATPPTSPKRSISKRQPSSQEKPGIRKFQISAPVELISTTNMISYTSPSLRSSLVPAPTSMPTSGHNPQGSISNHKTKGSISVKTEQNIRQAHYPPSPASSGGSLPPFSPDMGSGLEDLLTPPATPPPNHLTEYFPKRSRSSSNSSGANSHTRSSSSSGARKSGASAMSMERERQISRIRSVSSINSTFSSSGSSDRRREEVPAVPAVEIPVPRRSNTTSGNPDPVTSALRPNGSTFPPQLKSHKSTTSISSITTPSSPSFSIPSKSSARVSRSASSSSLRNSAKQHRHASSKGHVANPFAQELAKVSELAEDMGLDFDEDCMVRKGLLRYKADDYLDLIRDVMYSPAPGVPLRKKPSILKKPMTQEVLPFLPPAPVAEQAVAVGGWI